MVRRHRHSSGIPDPISSSSLGSIGTTTTTEESSQNRKRKWASPIWDEYNVFDGDQFPDAQDRAICKYCKGGPIFANSKNGTTNFKRHTENCHARVANDVGQLLLNKKANLDKKLDQGTYKELVALSIKRHDYSFSFAEHQGNRGYSCLFE
ncbi:unnamed protein product [Cuscuta campestris]|uniref:BED-type domain-containing protein n=1 Tax=Cuscuta campestris TaxID=132261 RepID=A0A484NFN3_9ASTE|nr:unnamed protein product [Cuscuta campestris]